MHVLVAYGSKMGGTAGIAELIGDALTDAGLQADVRPVAEVSQLDRYDAVVIGGALYTGHWHRQARRFVRRHTDALRERPVWLFSSGPLDGSPSRRSRRFPKSRSWPGGSVPATTPPAAADVAMELMSLDQLGRLHA
jgi:menaquinone-dependent protoporphyrinogen IX oxidase